MSGFLFLLAFFSAVSFAKSDTEACLKQDSCSCRFADGKVLNLTSLSSTNGTASFQAEQRGFFAILSSYPYNPCSGFHGRCHEPDTAICKFFETMAWSCGLQHTARFVHRNDRHDSEIFLLYTGGDLGRQSYVKLTCTDDPQSTFTFLSEVPAKTYNFELMSRCACPGTEPCQGIASPTSTASSSSTTTTLPVTSTKATSPTTTTLPVTSMAATSPTASMTPIISVTCVQKDGCTCEMSDGSGIINLRSLNKPEKPLEHFIADSSYHFNPCSGFSLPTHSPMNTCIDVSICEMVYSGELVSDILAIGDPHTARFSTKPDGTVILHYHAPGNKKSDVHLICDRSAREEPIFRYLHQHNGKSIFSLRSVCACPGECVGPARTCVPTDSCSCTYSDGSGTVNLHPLNNPFAPLKTTVHTAGGLVYDYYYNPCSGIELDEHCANVSACQRLLRTDATTEENSLGQTETQSFTNEQDGNLVLSYNGGTDGRTLKITLICDPSSSIPVFGYSKEDPIKHYSFTLRSKCACPGMCT